MAVNNSTIAIQSLVSQNSEFNPFGSGNSQSSGDLDLDGDNAWKKWFHLIQNSFLHINDPVVIVLVVFYCITFLVGIIGNFLVIFVFLNNPRMRTVTNLFLVNLAVCDLMVVCVCMPFSLAMDVYTNWIYGAVWCKMVNFTQGLSVSSSILTLAVISMERFMAISKPLRARAFLSKKRSRKIILVLWFISGIIMMPELFVKNDEIVERIFEVEIRSCVESWPTKLLQHAYTFVLLVLLYLIPLGLIFIEYCRISARLLRRDDNLHASHESSSLPKQIVRTLEKRRKVARMLVILAVIFAVSWMPKHILGFVMDFSNEEKIRRDGAMLRRLYSFALWFALANSSLNPICYCIMSESFKNAFKLAFRCCFGNKAILRPTSSSLYERTSNPCNNSKKQTPYHVTLDRILSVDNDDVTFDTTDIVETTCVLPETQRIRLDMQT